jgi:hypothetical protein
MLKPGTQIIPGGASPGGQWSAPDGAPQMPDPTRATRRRAYREYGLRPPAAVQRFARDFGGLNPFGGPMYRVSWAPSCLTWMAGKWRIDDDQGNFKFWLTDAGWAPKYPQYGERFILEHWKRPDIFGSPDSWDYLNRQYEETGEILGKLGPYPVHGQYEFCFHFQDTTGAFVLPTPTICELRIQEHRRQVKKREDDHEAGDRFRAQARESQALEKADVAKDRAAILDEPFSGLNGLITPYVSLAGVDVPSATGTTTKEEVN